MRFCNECTKCCEGWLAGSVNGQQFYPGVACNYMCNGCTIYKQRPEDPCRTFVCEWLVDESIPFWMRPDKSGVILKRDDDVVEMIECNPPLQTAPLEWFLTAYITGKYDNISYRIHNHPRTIRSQK